MTHDERLEAYARERLGGRAVPADLRTLLLLQWNGEDPSAGVEPLAGIGVHLLEHGDSHDLLDLSYLTDKDRANPDIMANVAAMQSTCEHAAFVARNDDGALIGYWFGPENLGIDSAPILKLDSEGQFDLLGGRTLSDALVGDTAFEDLERFAELKQAFADAGITIGANNWDELPYPDPPTSPGGFHEQRYEENLNKAG